MRRCSCTLSLSVPHFRLNVFINLLFDAPIQCFMLEIFVTSFMIRFHYFANHILKIIKEKIVVVIPKSKGSVIFSDCFNPTIAAVFRASI